MSRDAWDEFSKTILVRYVLSYLCGILYLDPSVSLKKMFPFSVGSLFSLSTHALSCLNFHTKIALLNSNTVALQISQKNVISRGRE